MIRKTRLLKVVAIYLILNTLQMAFWPSIALALTSGPTAPEYTTFEPVDTSSMVNLRSGDMSYTIPLLEVPGPEGGYPLSLSYHPGFNVEREASWVGLGWSLNPGAINRAVNIFPDDQFSASQTVDTQLNGIYRGGLSVGVGVPGGGPYADLDIGYDSNKGMGVNVTAGLAEIPIGPVTGNISGSFNSWSGEVSGSVGLSSGVGSVSGSLSNKNGTSISASTQSGPGKLNAGWSESAGVNASASAGPLGAKWSQNGGSELSANFSNMGISMRSSGPAVSMRAAGFSFNTSGISGAAIQSVSFDRSISIPTPAGVNLRLGVFFSRTWANDEQNLSVYGSLYPPGVSLGGNTHLFNPSNQAYDSFALFDPDYDSDEIPISQQEVDKQLGGSLIAYDSYSVLGQGIGGQIAPHSYENRYSYRTNVAKSSGYKLIEYQGYASSSTVPLTFRFVNDFSNSFYLNQDPEITAFQSGVLTIDNIAPTIGDNGNGYNSSRRMLAGSKHIEYFRVSEVLDLSARNNFGYMSPLNGSIATIVDGDQVVNQVGGFMITKEDGTTYHYGIPVYTYNEKEVYSKTDDGNFSLTKTRNQPYAYTWLLTAVTGPDFVDRDNDGMPSDGDWGYWVAFDYGKWADDFDWRNPGTDKGRDIDPNVEFYTQGQKEVYYLNSIRTRTHIALFEKEVRNDGKDLTVIGDSPSYEPIINNCPGYYSKPKSLMRLNRVLMLKIEDYHAMNLTGLSSASLDYGTDASYSCQPPGFSTITVPANAYHFDENVIDVQDIAKKKTDGVDIEAVALSVIEFGHDYSLVPETINSYDLEYGSAATTWNGNLTGKLTLRSLQTKGYGGQGALPPTNFSYGLEGETGIANQFEFRRDINNDYWSDYYVVDRTLRGRVQVGDIFKVTYNGNDYYFFVNEKGDSSRYGVNAVGYNSLGYLEDKIITAQETKNPPYRAFMTDYWGYYKGDWRQNASNKVLAEVTTAASARAADVWSLTKINTPIGAEIRVEYEPDTYVENVWQGNIAMTITDYQRISGQNFVVELTLNNEGYDLDNLFIPGNYSRIKLLGYYDAGLIPGIEPIIYDESAEIVNITTDGKLWVRSQTIWQGLQTDESKSDWAFAGGNMSVNNGEHIGGGLRVKGISVYDYVTGVTNTTHYYYEGGVTAFEPSGMGVTSHLDFGMLNDSEKNEVLAAYEKELFSGVSEVLSLSQLLPGPGVIYEKVRVSESITHPDGNQVFADGSVEYEFQVPKSNMLTHTAPSELSGTVDGVNVRTVLLKDLTNRIGLLKRVTKFGKEDMVVSETNHIYEFDYLLFDPEQDLETKYANQGIMHQFSTEKRKVETDNTNELGRQEIAVVTVEKRFPTINYLTKTTDYITGVELRHWNLAYDFYSGSTLEMVDEDQYGNYYLTKQTPAYWLPEYNPIDGQGNPLRGMGLKVHNFSNRNMLTQLASTAVFKASEPNVNLEFQENISRLVSAEFTTWGDQHVIEGTPGIYPQGIWRQAEAYVYRGDENAHDDGTYSYDQYYGDSLAFVNSGGYDMLVNASTDRLVRVSNRERYDVYSNLLEASTESNHYNAVKFGDEHSRIIVSAKNARYDEFFFTGFESTDNAEYSDFSNLSISNIVDVNTQSSSYSHTGSYVLEMDDSRTETEAFSLTISNADADLTKGYVASVWVRTQLSNDSQTKLEYAYNGGGPAGEVTYAQSPIESGEWKLLRLYIPPGQGSTSLTIKAIANNTSTFSWFDDFMVFPVSGGIGAYIYNSSGQVGWIIGSTGTYARYEYNSLGRLTAMFTESLEYGQENPNYLTQEVQVSSQTMNFGRNAYQD